MGFEDNSWDIAIRQLSYKIPSTVTSVFVAWYATKYKDLSKYFSGSAFLRVPLTCMVESPLVVTFGIMLIASIAFACIKPSWNVAQIVLTALTGIGCAGPLTLLVACVQFTAPHAFLSTATGLAFSARAIGGAFGTAVIYAVINSRIASHYASDVGVAAVTAGLPQSSVAALLTSMKGATATTAKGKGVPGANEAIMNAAWQASYWSYARAYRLGWWSVVPFVAMATIAVACMTGVKELMTEKVEATVEHESGDEAIKMEKA
jgi:hypothetical protein